MSYTLSSYMSTYYLPELDENTLIAVNEIDSKEDLREFFKSVFSGLTISISLNSKTKNIKAIDVKLPEKDGDVESFIVSVLYHLYRNKGFFANYVKVAVSQKPVKAAAKVTETTFVEVLCSLGFNAAWASSTKSLYKYRKMSAVIVKEGGTYLIYDFNRGHGYIKLLSERAKKASEVSSSTDVLGEPQIVFDEI